MNSAFYQTYIAAQFVIVNYFKKNLKAVLLRLLFRSTLHSQNGKRCRDDDKMGNTESYRHSDYRGSICRIGMSSALFGIWSVKA